jgi:hypothetical protein
MYACKSTLQVDGILYACIRFVVSKVHFGKKMVIIITTRKHGFSKCQLHWNVHIDPKVCPLWLQVWGMKNTCYILPVHLIKVTFLTKSQAENLVKNGQMSIKMAMAYSN